jgi:hypothetical protein
VRSGGGPGRTRALPVDLLDVQPPAAGQALEHGSTRRAGRSIVRLVTVGNCESQREQTLGPAVSAKQGLIILPRAGASIDVFSVTGRERTSIGQDPHVDRRTKLLVAGMVLFVLACLVIGGILAIASPPNSCC